MKTVTSLASLFALLAANELLAQAPVVAGTYSGSVGGSLSSKQARRNGVFDLGVWTIRIETESCEDCAPGQYSVYSRYGFTGMQDVSTKPPESGDVRAYINPSGKMIDVSFLIDNCQELNPNNQDLTLRPWPLWLLARRTRRRGSRQYPDG